MDELIATKATVLLNANMAFLSIQSVDNGGQRVLHRSAAQIASYISIVTSLGSVILSLLLVRQNRSKGRQTAAEAVRILFMPASLSN
jgi:predicted Co/Zn/Cd cation transporter (cation efflux family)